MKIINFKQILFGAGIGFILGNLITLYSHGDNIISENKELKHFKEKTK